MLSVFLFATATASAAAPAPAIIPPAMADIVPSVPLAERVHGAQVSDRTGTPLGVIDNSDASLVVVIVGTHKIQLPAAALRRLSGVLTLPITVQQIEQTLAAAVAYQAQAHLEPQPVQPPKGFVPLKPIAAARSVPQ